MLPLFAMASLGLVLWGLSDLVLGLWSLLRALCTLVFGVIPSAIAWLWGR